MKEAMDFISPTKEILDKTGYLSALIDIVASRCDSGEFSIKTLTFLN